LARSLDQKYRMYLFTKNHTKPPPGISSTLFRCISRNLSHIFIFPCQGMLLDDLIYVRGIFMTSVWDCCGMFWGALSEVSEFVFLNISLISTSFSIILGRYSQPACKLELWRRPLQYVRMDGCKLEAWIRW